MVLIDWTLSSYGSTAVIPSLDATVKYAGVSSLRCNVQNHSLCYSRARHSTFSETKMQLLIWARTGDLSTSVPQVNLASYGSLILTNTLANTWERFRVSFWYDVTSNTKWGRVERWDGSVWTFVGADGNMGVGSPAAGAMFIEARGIGNLTQPCYCWFDELEVYS